MTRENVLRPLAEAQMELYRHDDDALQSAQEWLDVAQRELAKLRTADATRNLEEALASVTRVVDRKKSGG